MAKELFIARQTGGERAILVHIDFTRHSDPTVLEEFLELVRSAGVQCLELITGHRERPTPKYFVGKGKAQEIELAVQNHQAEVVIFDHTLSPSQLKNLEQLCHCRVLDRTELILDIFAQRARTHEGKLQVELAQLQYLASRLVRGWTHLERQQGGIGLRGPGETQLELDRRWIEQRIFHLKQRLQKVAQQRQQSRRKRQRNAIPIVALVGYTNAGKTTLFNALTQADTFVANQLFATLDPTLRQIQLPHIGSVLMADTVGFIRDLPPDLIAAFRATLEETRLATLLLHVVDAHSPQHQWMIDEVNHVLQQIGADAVPQLLVYNKADLLPATQSLPLGKIDRDELGNPTRVWISALQKQGLVDLQDAMSEKLPSSHIYCCIKLAPQEASLRAALFRHATIEHEEFDQEGYSFLTLEIAQGSYQQIFQESRN